ncbi:MAG: hypothetical protein K0U84_09445 [Actinomycetia bacterium]|nr:hypothetical protein [Actinomycetes bacterium]
MPDLAALPEHLYYTRWVCWDGCPPNEDLRGILAGHDCYEIVACPITRSTAKRIYFREPVVRLRSGLIDHGPEYFVDRMVIERDGEIFHRGLRKSLQLAPPELRSSPPPKSVADLRREMADCHPDRGGDPAEFRRAHARYMAAKAVAK